MSNTQTKKRKQANQQKNKVLNGDLVSKSPNAEKITATNDKNKASTKEGLDSKTRFWIMFLTIITFGIFKIYLNDKVEKAKKPKECSTTKTPAIDELKVSKKIPFKIEELVEYLGGFQNIEKFDASLNSLKVTFKEKTLVSQEKIKNLGAKGIMFSEHTISIIFGDYSLFLKEELEKLSKTEIAKVSLKA